MILGHYHTLTANGGKADNIDASINNTNEFNYNFRVWKFCGTKYQSHQTDSQILNAKSLNSMADRTFWWPRVVTQASQHGKELLL